jgi:hypothetical protein
MYRTVRFHCAMLALALSASAASQTPSYLTAEEPHTDGALGGLPGGVMFSMPGIANDMVLSGGSQFVELPDGTARLTGRIRSLSRIYAGLLVDLQFSGRIDPGSAAWPPAGSPNLQLALSAYTPAGPIDPGLFHFYTAASGTMTGVRELDGAQIALQLQPGTSVQVGVGANNRDGLPGVCGRFDVQVLANPAPPFGPASFADFAADLRANRSFAATHVMVDTARSPLANDRAMALPGLTGEFLFVPAASMTEYTDGHAEVHGTLARIDILSDRWRLDLLLNSRSDPGQASWPPAGAPILGLYPDQYAALGGPIDPSHWHYYAAATGTLFGLDDNDGGLIALTQSTPFQVGGGANQANTYFGYFGECTAQLLMQPVTHTVALLGNASLHGLTGTFPVLPLPFLTVPQQAPTLPTLTDAGVVIAGQHLAWTNAVSVGMDYLTSQATSSWYRGYFKVLDDQHLEVHPTPGRAAGTYPVRAFNPAINTNAVNVALTPPTSPTLRADRSVQVGAMQHVFVHDGGGMKGPVLTALCLSFDLLPSVQANLVSLDIGNDFQTLVVLPDSLLHDPVSGVATQLLGPIPPELAGLQVHFQGAVLDLDGASLPLPVTDVWTVNYTL